MDKVFLWGTGKKYSELLVMFMFEGRVGKGKKRKKKKEEKEE